jgi:hypothetical protein
MRYEDVLFHKYYNEIKKQCFEDVPGTQISNWVKNTVDADESIPADKKAEMYLSDKKINSYKTLLKEKTQEVTVTMGQSATSYQPVTAVAPAAQDTEVTNKVSKEFAPILVKDIEKNTVVINETFFNLFNLTQGQLFEQMKKALEFGFADPMMTRSIRSLIAELRQLLELWCKISGREDFARVIGAGAGQAVVQNMLSDTTKQKLKEFVRDLLADVDPQEIPRKLTELEGILNGQQ